MTAIPSAPMRQRLRTSDLQMLQRAAPTITELGADLDRRLATESRPGERLRLLRETTNRITRTANDAVEAYRRSSRSLSAELAKPNGNAEAASELRVELRAARLELLRVLELAGRRYPAPTDPTAHRG